MLPGRDYLTGDWNGVRRELAERGVTFGIKFVSDDLGNPWGGLTHAFKYTGSFAADMNVDFGVLAGWTGFNFYTSAVVRNGENLAKNVGCVMFPAQIYGSETILLNELYIRQIFYDDLFEIKLGRLDAGNDFMTSPLYFRYVSGAINAAPPGVYFNVPFSIYPNATWGAYLQAKFGPILGKVAVYNANSDIWKNRYHGLNFTFSSTDGALLITEWAYLKENGLTGAYRAGYFYTTGTEQTYLNGEKDGNYSYYLLLEQMVYHPPSSPKDVGLTPWLALVYAPKDRNLFPFTVSGGLTYQGLVKGRPNDKTSFGFVYSPYSSDYNEQRKREGERKQNYELNLELNHWFQVTPWLEITPDIQVIVNPSGLGTIPTALVLGFQFSVVF